MAETGTKDKKIESMINMIMRWKSSGCWSKSDWYGSQIWGSEKQIMKWSSRMMSLWIWRRRSEGPETWSGEHWESIKSLVKILSWYHQKIWSRLTDWRLVSGDVAGCIVRGSWIGDRRTCEWFQEGCEECLGDVDPKIVNHEFMTCRVTRLLESISDRRRSAYRKAGRSCWPVPKLTTWSI